jgi:hypothetical protein
MKRTLLILSFAAFLACNTPETPLADNTLTEAEKAEGWQLLFDGKSTDGWYGYNKDSFPAGWVIDSGTIKSLGTANGDTGGDIIFKKDQFENFELTVDWKISTGGNSGIFYHVIEDTQYHAPYENAPEFQLIDDLKFPEKLEKWQMVGADYAMYEPPADKKVKPAGEWNTSRIRFTAEKVEYFLNGANTASFVAWSDDWNKRRNSGKWDAYPDYGKAKTGYIALQDHGSEIWFKNLKIRKL